MLTAALALILFCRNQRHKCNSTSSGTYGLMYLYALSFIPLRRNSWLTYHR